MEWRRMRKVWVLAAITCLAGSALGASGGLLPEGDYLCVSTSRDDAALPSDDFTDGQIGSLWWLDADDAANCWLDETHQRLELRSTSRSQWASAHYVSRDWTIDTTRDFLLRVDFHHGLICSNTVWLALVLVPDFAHRDAQYITFGVSSSEGYSYFWYETMDEYGTRSKFTTRDRNDGTLYLSYDAKLDELYLGHQGYGASNAWMTIRGFLRGTWDSPDLDVMLEGGSNLTQVSSGQVYFDNFVVEGVDQSIAQFSDVYRFWSPATDAHFYTISEAEKDKLIRDYDDVWVFEGVAFEAAKIPFVSGLAPVYRFWSDVSQSHFYTISEKERDKLLKEYKGVWKPEGIAFYAYPEGKQPYGTKPVYRFWSPVEMAHFYTISESEKDKFLKDYCDVYSFEGIAFYAYE